MRLVRLLPLAVLILVPGCGLFSGNGDFGEPDYASEASTNLKRGDEALDSSQYQLAEKYFEYVKTKFPFLEASRQAELRLADVSFERELWTEAADRYNGFVKLHPTHAKVDYAAYRAALSHYRDIPRDWFLLPPSSEKDQTQVRAAWEALNEFTRTYTQSQYLEDAKKKQVEIRERLVRHEVYVADFYEKRDRWSAAASRLETVLQKYPGPDDDKYLFRLHDLYSRLKDQAKARDALQRVITRLPGTPAAERAQKMLGS
ncbi:MAG TPA: outer membrane protein assembly factor BamD [Myxococcaceae bacterium]|nr:outer membrane protein assembly factor BamD [Myxococcaceae bacterium]